LAHKGTIDKVLIDTCHFKGNYPDSCTIQACTISTQEEADIQSDSIQWKTLLPNAKLQADFEHYFENELIERGPFTHVRLNIFPDGGISRMRLFGHIVNN
jgi:allantoicase